jgi:hypothetical protein
MRIGGVFCVGILVGTGIAAADPFVGTWVYNLTKSPKPTITFTIRDLGENRISLTGSTNRTIILKAGGKPVRAPGAGTVSLKKISETTWEEIRADPDRLVRTFSVSPDDKVMTLVDIYAFVDGTERKDITRYSRLSQGKGLFGEWRSIFVQRQQSGGSLKLIIQPYSQNGLSISFPGYSRVDMNLDGKMYPIKGPGILRPTASEGERASPRFLRLETQIDGKLDDREEYRVSDGGKTLTIISRPATSSAVFRNVYDRQ